MDKLHKMNLRGKTLSEKHVSSDKASMDPVCVSHLVLIICSISLSFRFQCLSQPGLGTAGPHAQAVVKAVGSNDL